MTLVRLHPGSRGSALSILDLLDTGVFTTERTAQVRVALEARRGLWGLATDVVFIDLEVSKHATREFGIGGVEIPSTINADLKLGLTGWLWSPDGSYAIVQRDKLSMSVLAGARMLDLQEDLRYTFNGNISSLPVAGRTGSAQAQQAQWDAIAGLKRKASLGAGGPW